MATQAPERTEKASYIACKSIKKEFWNEAIVIVTSNNSLGQTEISYLENRFFAIATKVQRYRVENANEPTQGNVTEEKACKLEEFIEYAKILTGVLGHKVFEPLVDYNQNDDKNGLPTTASPIFIIKKRGASARCANG